MPKHFLKKIGSRAEVKHGVAEQTSYGKKGLKAHQIRKNKWGKYVSIKASNMARKKGTLKKWMKKHGLKVVKGKFGLQGTKKKRARGSRRRSRRRRCRHKSGRNKGRYKKC